MITASRLAGFFAAHAIWCVSDGETLVPILAYTTAEDERKMERLVVDDDLAASVARGKERLASNEMNAVDAALLYDARISAGNETLDAIVIELRDYLSAQSEAVMAVPYTPKGSGTFLVHKPKLLAWENCADADMEPALQAFFEGVGSHEKGAKVWNESLDESK